MADIKDIRGTTPSYSVIPRDSNNVLIDPTSIDKIEIKIYNLKTETEVAKYTTESGPPEGYISLTVSSSDIQFVIPEANTLAAESGDNRIEIWTTEGSNIECQTAILNEFIDSKDA